MSIEDLTGFFTRLQQDEALREQAFALQDADAAERLDGLCRLARENGFDVTAEDWRHEGAGEAVAALDDQSLRQVVGGAGCVATGTFLGGPHEGEPVTGL